MIIVIAGIKRSGSTVQFNLVRIALEMAGYKVNICGHSYRPRKVPKGEVDLVKRHKFSKEIAEAADHIFTTDRKDNEILASLKRFNSKKPNPERLKDMRKHLKKWNRFTPMSHWFHYEEWKMSRHIWVTGIIHVLSADVDINAVLQEFNKIKPPKSGQDPKTLMFHNHITSV